MGRPRGSKNKKTNPPLEKPESGPPVQVPEPDPTVTTTAPKPQAYWTVQEEVFFLEYLIVHLPEAGDGGHFPMATFTGAANHVNSKSGANRKGLPKTGKICQNKYTAFKKIFGVIQDLLEQSGFGWDNEKGALINGPEEQAVWEDYVKKHPDAKRFRNSGWVHWDKFSQLTPSRARGGNAFHAGHSEGIPSSSQDISSATNTIVDPVQAPPNTDATPVAGGTSSDTQGLITSRSQSPVITATTPIRFSQKRRHQLSAEPSSGSSTPMLKKPRLTGADAISSLGDQIGEFGVRLEGLFKVMVSSRSGSSASTSSNSVPMPSSPSRKRNAMELASDLEKDLPMDRLSALIEVFEKDASAADAYITTCQPG